MGQAPAWLIAIVLCFANKIRLRSSARAPSLKSTTCPIPEVRRLSCLFVPLQTANMSESTVVSTIVDDRDPSILYLPDASDWTVHTQVGAQFQLHGNTDTFRSDIVLQTWLKLLLNPP
jgi:hypothetical protein